MICRGNRVLAIVVTYYPDRQQLIRNIAAFIEHVDKVLIWENTPNPDRLSFRIPKSEKIVFSGDGVNSISRALNYGWQFARMNGYDYLLTMDQDSLFVDFKKYLEKTIGSSTAPIGIFVPRLVFTQAYAQEYVETYRPITSGMLVPIQLLNLVGGYRDDFQIDGIDFDFCARARSKKIPTFIVNPCEMEHRFGESEEVSFLARKVTIYNYGESRLYGMMRNHALVLKDFRRVIPRKIRREVSFAFFFKMPIKILLFEDNKYRKIRACFSGIMDGFFSS